MIRSFFTSEGQEAVRAYLGGGCRPDKAPRPS